jgi:hypothetical protein
MSVERSQDEGERFGISEPHGYAKTYVLLRRVEIGFVLPYWWPMMKWVSKPGCFANLVGRENVMAGADCGFSSQALYKTEVEVRRAHAVACAAESQGIS